MITPQEELDATICKTLTNLLKSQADNSVLVSEASEQYGSSEEFFDGWLPLSIAANNKVWGYTDQELRTIRTASRIISNTNEIQKNCLSHYRNFVIGEGVSVDLFPVGSAVELLSAGSNTGKSNGKIKKLMENWRLFANTNKLDARLRNAILRKHRDGEVWFELFPGKLVPALRFVEPDFLFSSGKLGEKSELGVITDGKDLETATGYEFENTNIQGSYRVIKPENIVVGKANVDFDAPRGIPTGWPVFTNLRRVEKLLVNTSILSAIHSAIAYVRTTPGANQASVSKMLAANRDTSQARTSSSTGKQYNTRGIKGGTILSANDGTKYEFPAHNADPSKWIAVLDNELGHVAAGWVLPVKWLLADEPTDPLTPGSPVVANFRSEQADMSTMISELFWKVQAMMGIDVEAVQAKFELMVDFPNLAIGKVLDEARVDDLALKNGVVSPQEIAQKYGRNYFVVRSNIIAHRATRQPGEVMPGEQGNTNTSPDGLSKAGSTGQRTSDPAGGNNSI